ncbi:hypothetical protein BDK92_1804 [Micromonospora pisi]|uniref:Uncharacterized protein n=1 Tax=Micromonospora pisi TaxID=589240 RepID=A0A495JFA2_9ACTN|nr:hypothetical protein [Micromonospora pisi]RKR87525.1 hypothetical protein BDK92_1804 [Micromonospora pisi]
MTQTWSDTGRSGLREEARRRLRRRMLVTILVVAPLPALAIVLGGLAADRGTPLINWLLIGAGAVLVTVGLLTAAWLVQRQHLDPPLVTGADAQTRRAVRQAIRTGNTDDPRIDLLARDLIAHSPRETAVPYLLGALALVALLLLAFSDWDTEDIVRGLVTAPCLVVAAFLVRRRQHRLRNYRGLHP